MLGAEANVHLGAGFSLFGQAGGGLMVGDTRLSYQELDNNGLNLIAAVEQQGQSRVVPMTEVAAGINWSGPLGNNTRLDASFGYSLENWFNAMDIIRFSDSTGSGVINQETGDLSSGGLFFGLGVQMDF